MRRRHAETTTRRNRPPDHPRGARIGVPVRIALAGERLADFWGHIIAFDRSWVKVRFEGKKPRLREGTGVGLQFGTGRDASLPLQGIVWTLDPDDVMTVLLSLSTREFESLKSLAAGIVEQRKASARSPSPPAWLDWRSAARARTPWTPAAPPEAPAPLPETPEDPVEGSDEAEDQVPSHVSETLAEPVEATEPQTFVDEIPELVEASAEPARAASAPEEEPQAAPVEPPVEAPQSAAPLQAAPQVREGDYKGAAQFFFEGLRTQPINLSLWCALGATMYQLGKKKAAADVLQHVVRHGRVDSREVHLARSWLERLGAAAQAEEQRRPEPSGASHPEAQAERVEPQPFEVRQARSGPSPAQQAAVLASQGDYKEAARLYYKALRETLHAASDDLLLWYAMGVTLSHLGRKWEAAEAFRHLVRHGRPDSKEVRLAQLWLERGEVPADPTGVEPPRARPPADPASRTETRPVEARRRPPARPPVVEDEFGSYEAAPAVPPQPRARRASPPDAPEVRVKPAPPARPPVVEDEFGSYEAAPPVPPQPRARRASPPDAPEVRVKPSPPAPAPHGGGRAVPGRRRRGVGPSPGEQAAILAAQGHYAEAASLYAEAVGAKPEDSTLWYALGVTLRRLNRPQEAAEALRRVVRHGEPESLVRLARLWLERGGVEAERADDPGGGSPRKGRPRRGASDRD